MVSCDASGFIRRPAGMQKCGFMNKADKCISKLGPAVTLHVDQEGHRYYPSSHLLLTITWKLSNCYTVHGYGIQDGNYFPSIYTSTCILGAEMLVGSKVVGAAADVSKGTSNSTWRNRAKCAMWCTGSILG
ncbi:hypothetical protein EmuJ_000408500 [Echinococcus multilocularis]|uniref:Uncharacterized protein n=1 Tax=Echinococcus multilocularis TaxID=6211 RepID=A0A068Y358_ECHMU|nr:hypothetical protein EmuJ_000408500 [Echinococcus multilocularis]